MGSLVLPISLLVALISFISASGPPDKKPFLLGIPTHDPRKNEIPYHCPENERYHKCDMEVCYKTCEHLSRPPACPSLDSKCYKPACLCEKDKLRNAAGKCIPAEMCPKDNEAVSETD